MNIWFLFTLISLLTVQIGKAEEFINQSIPEEGWLNFTELAQRYGLPCEEHDVSTEDGYILKLFHIKGNSSRPILLWHGVLDSADTYIIRGNISTCMSLANAGHDIWVGNTRGNKYSRRHVNMNPDKDKNKFWNFSFHEFGYYDLPASIDYVLNKTQQQKIVTVGHSQGTTIFHVLGATRPEYNEKIQLFIALAPVVHMEHLKPIIARIIPIWPILKAYLKMRKFHEILSDHSEIVDMIRFICSQGCIGNAVCNHGVLMPISGVDREELEPEFFRILLGHFPTGTSLKDIDHFIQVHNRKHFALYDYGVLENLKRYGTMDPPDYDLSKVTMPIALLCAENDNFSVLKDISKLREQLANVVFYKVMERKEFNHIDYIWGKHMDVYMNPLLNKIIDLYGYKKD